MDQSAPESPGHRAFYLRFSITWSVSLVLAWLLGPRRPLLDSLIVGAVLVFGVVSGVALVITNHWPFRSIPWVHIHWMLSGMIGGLAGGFVLLFGGSDAPFALRAVGASVFTGGTWGLGWGMWWRRHLYESADTWGGREQLILACLLLFLFGLGLSLIVLTLSSRAHR